MREPIRIHHADTADQVRERHERIVARLDELGPEQVRFLQGNGKLTTEWDPIISAWFADRDAAPSDNDQSSGDNKED